MPSISGNGFKKKHPIGPCLATSANGSCDHLGRGKNSEYLRALSGIKCSSSESLVEMMSDFDVEKPNSCLATVEISIMSYMRAVRLQPNKDEGNPYSVSNPAPASALLLEHEVSKPRESPGILVRVKTSTVIRDALTWPETYNKPKKILGNDFAGIIVAIPDNCSSGLKVGDRVYGMTHADTAGTWADYISVKEDEVCLMPPLLDWEKAAVVPLTALTAYQALFKKAGFPCPDFNELDMASVRREKTTDQVKDILILGASGAVGGCLLNFASCIPWRVTAATRFPQRTKEGLLQAGADRVIDYKSLLQLHACFDIIIDTVGGKTLEHCWELVTESGIIISVHSDAANFPKEYNHLEAARKRPNVKPIWFIVKPSSEDLQAISAALINDVLVPRVAEVIGLEHAPIAYEKACASDAGIGKIVLKISE